MQLHRARQRIVAHREIGGEVKQGGQHAEDDQQALHGFRRIVGAGLIARRQSDEQIGETRRRACADSKKKKRFPPWMQGPVAVLR